tara:strand:+ start:402 stop:746 length:345 start_codon:yes stop_codon:yes gene_type:complete
MEKHLILKQINDSEYYQHALSFAVFFVENQMRSFTSEDLKDEFYKEHNEPSEPRVWGSVIRELKKRKLILFKGYVKYKNPKGHARPATQWVSLKYHLTQKRNRQSNGRNQQELF